MVSLVERFGETRAHSDVVRCVVSIVTEQIDLPPGDPKR